VVIGPESRMGGYVAILENVVPIYGSFITGLSIMRCNMRSIVD